jgi:hypothetical protein
MRELQQTNWTTAARKGSMTPGPGLNWSLSYCRHPAGPQRDRARPPREPHLSIAAVAVERSTCNTSVTIVGDNQPQTNHCEDNQMTPLTEIPQVSSAHLGNSPERCQSRRRRIASRRCRYTSKQSRRSALTTGAASEIAMAYDGQVSRANSNTVDPRRERKTHGQPKRSRGARSLPKRGAAFAQAPRKSSQPTLTVARDDWSDA